MLYGIDISSWQEDIDLSPLPVDFVIVKATEGVTYVNPYFKKKADETLKLGKLLGVYHYARANDPEKEAQWFIDNIVPYMGIAIPVLDWEENQDVNWVNRFVDYYKQKTGVWCWIYANPWRFNQGGVREDCDRWIASYPNVLRPGLDYDPGDVPKTDGVVCCWQYASDGQVSGYNGNLDINHFYGDEKAWRSYAKGSPWSGDVTPTTPPASKVSTLENDKYKVTIEDKES